MSYAAFATIAFLATFLTPLLVATALYSLEIS